MTREEFLRKKIAETNTNLKAIAMEIGVPYSTLRDMQTNVGSARIDNVIKLCRYLGITVDELNASKSENFEISEVEKQLVISYRKNTNMREAVNKLLDIDQPAMIKSFRTASSSDNHEPEILEMQDLSAIPESDNDEI